ncbi:VCBS repeat-containing protein [candidate division WOR-3 bacterium]|nr:VCBS repeat-containing protein [candidate division WOR-3 bacterium]
MKVALALVLVSWTGYAAPVLLTRDGQHPVPQTPPVANLTLQFSSELGSRSIPVQRFTNLRLFRDFPLPSPTRGRQDLNILVLKVEFVEDDHTYTTGNGKMDLTGYGTSDDGLYYDPPHTGVYFERQMQFLSNYYKVNSFGNCNVTCTVKPDHNLASYQLPHEMRYYSGFVEYDADNGFVYYNVYAMEMGLVRILADAVAAADQDETVDFSAYDAIVIFHAGTQWQTSINFMRFCDIPSATIPPGALEFYLGVPYILANGGADTIDFPVSINAEMARVDQYMVGAAGTVIHEFGHILNLPDLYDITGWSNGVGAFDLMGTGGWVGSPAAGAPEGSIPANMGAWTRYALGWVNPLVVTSPESLLAIRASSIDTTQYGVVDQTMIKVPISPTEFFLIENRQQDVTRKDTIIIDAEDGVPIYVEDGEFDFFLPASGIAIWHIDDNVINAHYATNTIQINPQHKGIDLEEADGIQHFDAYYFGDSLEYYGSRYDLFFADDSNKANRKFGPFTIPNSDSYYGKSMLNIEVLSPLDTMMRISVGFDIYQAGFPLVVQNGVAITDVTYGDLDGDGDMEIIVATAGGRVHAYRNDGTLYASRYVGSITTFLAVGDVNGDNADDIAFGSGLNMVCLSGLDLVPLPSFPFTAGNAITGAPLIFDLDGDGKSEIIFGSKDRNLYALTDNGSNIPYYPVFLNTELLSTPCVFSAAGRKVGVLGSDGRFWLLDGQGIIREFTEASHNMLTYASPVVGDLDRDGENEAVIINGYGTIYIFGENELKTKFDILIDTVFYYTPALADIDNDGYLEIIMPNSSRTLYVTNRNGTLVNEFPVHYDDHILYPLLVADLDNSGREEIIFGLANSDPLSTGCIKIINDRKTEFNFSPLFGAGGFSSPGVIVDLDGDGDMELICGSDHGKLYAYDFPGTRASWKGYMNAPNNAGYFEGELSPVQIASTLLGVIQMYPSPVKNTGRARFFLNQAADVTVEILDITGRSLGEVTLSNTTHNEYNEVEFDFTRQSNGLYILRVKAQNAGKSEVKFKKFAVLK